VFKFGKGIQGKSLREGSERQLQWYVDALERSIQDPEKAKWKDSNLREMHAALEALAALHESKMRNEEEYAFEQIPEEAAE
jgi:galactokinase